MLKPGQLRRRLRAGRRRLTPQVQRDHAKALARHLDTNLRFRRARRVAFYIAADGEIDPAPVLRLALRAGKRCYLPVLRKYRPGYLWFHAYRRHTCLRRNRFGILEPTVRKRERAAPWGLDMILVPLVGFDRDCHRLGMGGGFYDRTLGYMRLRRHWKAPLLIGLAHECQRVDRIDARPWDVALDGVVTERGWYPCGDTERHRSPQPTPANSL
jgi:5-formyltetrahydrofolate cyclo-ligase